jgi:hypothetical protein
MPLCIGIYDGLRMTRASAQNDKEAMGMDYEKAKWVRKYSDRAFNCWRDRARAIAVSQQYRRQLKTDLSQHYDDPLRRQFVEMTWAD